jgi:hypothetical protein
MPSARQPAAALADRAERHLFERLGELPATERRVLALLVLADVPVSAAAVDLGIEEEAVRAAAARARKALRRSRVPLAGGARCERAEGLHSQRLDAPLDRHDRKWLDIHLARCPRCEAHVSLLSEALAELRDSFVAEPPALLAAPEPSALGEGRARLRVVPPASETVSPPPVVAQKHPGGAIGRPTLSPAALRAAKIVAIVLAIAVLLAGLGLGIADLSGQ